MYWRWSRGRPAGWSRLDGLELREALDAVTATMERQGIRIREIIDLPQIVR